ncbi:dihydroorotase [Inquilinus sp. OTU3971]|uniref:dihydroorotase n=1 Tax=Inquilinus sp. OTU3971 TaxID=3043855 RepID=UPI00313E34A5
MTAQPPIGRLTIRRPDDWHLHLRDGAMLRAVLPHTTAHFARAIIMPNLTPPVVTTADARAYRDRILAALPAGARFTPLMTAYLTEGTDPDDLARGQAEGVLTAVKLYPAGATTNSHGGVRDLAKVRPALERMQAIGLPLLVHGEVVDPEVDIFDREAVFIERHLQPIRTDFPELRIVCEHVTTQDGVDFVLDQGDGRVGATITPQHLVLNRNDLLVGGVRPHYYCLPVVKRERHRLALRAAATSGDPRFFLGTDSAPHPVHAKETACGCAGVFNARVALACYAQVFEEEGALDRFEAFASLNGPAFYGLPVNEETVTLVRGAEDLPERLPVPGGDDVHVFRGKTVPGWRVEG